MPFGWDFLSGSPVQFRNYCYVFDNAYLPVDRGNVERPWRTKKWKDCNHEGHEEHKDGIRRAFESRARLTYMKLAGVKIGLLMNFNVTKLKDGIKRFVL